MQPYIDNLRDYVDNIMANDPRVREHLADLKKLREKPAVREAVESMAATAGGARSFADVALETIVSRVGRPVLAIQDDDYLFAGEETRIWKGQLDNDRAHKLLSGIIPSVGRIEVTNHHVDWLGTGFLVTDDIIVTNRHVAEAFCLRQADGGLKFRQGLRHRSQPMTARIDFREEMGRDDAREFRLVDILHIEPADGHDVAFFRVEQSSSAGRLSRPLDLSTTPAQSRDYVCTIGYPAADSRLPDQDLVLRIFGDVYDVKRMAPGQVMRTESELVTHDCSTLGGNSGSSLVNLDDGKVVGLHFSGLFLQENRAVPAAVVAGLLEKFSRRPGPRGKPGEKPAPTPPPTTTTTPAASDSTPAVTATVPTPSGTALPSFASGQEATFTIPLQISVRLGTPAGGPGMSVGLTAGASTGDAVAHAQQQYGANPQVLAVRSGFVFREGWITDEPAVVIVLRGDAEAAPAAFPAQIGGLPVEVRTAGPWDYLEAEEARAALEEVPAISYKKPNFELTEVDEEMTVTCHVSPDAGWPTLEDFLSRTRRRLVIGIYDLTAPHVIDAIAKAVAEAPDKLELVIQKKASLGGGVKKDDIDEEEVIKRFRRKLKDRFDFAWASVGKNRQFASSYHIKVIVQDGKSFWLSSGNLQSSNQPAGEIDESLWKALNTYNREWNAVVQNDALAKQYEKYLRYDLKNAKADADVEAAVLPSLEFLVDPLALAEARASGTPRYFPAKTFTKRLRVMPLLTPDNYQAEVLKLIKSAKREILFQNQSLSVLDGPKNDPRFTALAQALLEKQQRGVSLRIIMRGEFDVSLPLERLQALGFDMSQVRLQDRCHTKGIIVDGRAAVVGSHNWTNQGTLVNRDASLIFHDKAIATYYSNVFWFDWNHLTRQSVAESRRITPATGAARESADGRERLTLEQILLG